MEPPISTVGVFMLSHHLAPPHVGLNCGSIRSPGQKVDFKQRCHPIWEMVDYILSHKSGENLGSSRNGMLNNNLYRSMKGKICRKPWIYAPNLGATNVLNQGFCGIIFSSLRYLMLSNQIDTCCKSRNPVTPKSWIS